MDNLEKRGGSLAVVSYLQRGSLHATFKEAVPPPPPRVVYTMSSSREDGASCSVGVSHAAGALRAPPTLSNPCWGLSNERALCSWASCSSGWRSAPYMSGYRGPSSSQIAPARMCLLSSHHVDLCGSKVVLWKCFRLNAGGSDISQ